MVKDSYYFISDAHLGLDEEKQRGQEKKLVEFLESIKESAKELYLVGDMFDFWFEYNTVVPADYFKVLFALKKLSLSGTKIVYVGGNHDFWEGDFLEREIGIEVHFKPITINLGIKKVVLNHGDGFLKDVLNFDLAKKILRNKLNIFLYQLVHPDIGIPLGRFVARQIRNYVYKKTDFEKAHFDYRRAAIEFLSHADVDVIIMGHTHKPDLYKKNGKIYINLGDWISNFTYAVFKDGEFQLKKF